MSQLPKTTKALTVQKAAAQSGSAYRNDAKLVESTLPELKPGQVLVKVTAAGFNHKDVWIRKGQYPGITIGSVYGGDGAGVVIASSAPNDSLLNRRVFLAPSRGWKSSPTGPESRFSILGGSAVQPSGTFAEYIAVEREYVLPTPDHLDDIHAAAWPIGGVTAWRAVAVNANVQAGQHVLVTGIGGGVALIALQLCIALGASAYVTSGSPEKIQKAIALGAKGGANYKEKNWPAQIHALIQKDKTGALLDAVIDSGGGDILGQTSRYLKPGGRVVCYGMTASPTITMTMKEVLQNQQLVGSTMGSQKDLADATAFIATHRIVPIVSHVVDGLESAEEGFELINRGNQFGKVVINMTRSDSSVVSSVSNSHLRNRQNQDPRGRAELAKL